MCHNFWVRLGIMSYIVQGVIEPKVDVVQQLWDSIILRFQTLCLKRYIYNKINNRAKNNWKKKQKKKKENKVKIYKSTFHIIHSIIFITITCFINSKALRFIILLLLKHCLQIMFCCAIFAVRCALFQICTGL